MIKLLEKYFVISWIMAILIAAAIFYVSGLTGKAIGPPVSSWKAIAYHYFAFFFLAFFLLPALARGKRKSFIFVAVIIAVMYGVMDELHQRFVPGRCCAFSDFMIDCGGILLASFIYTASFYSRGLKKLTEKNKKPLEKKARRKKRRRRKA